MLELGGLTVPLAAARAQIAVALAQPLVMAGVSTALVVDTYAEQLVSTELNATEFAGNLLLDRVWVRDIRRHTQPAAARLEKNFGLAPGFHHLVDPTTAKTPVTLIFEDLFAGQVFSGAGAIVFGFAEHLSGGDPATLVGIGFKADATHAYHTFVHDCPANVAPVTIRHDVALAGYLSTDLHRLTVIIDGLTKTITWLIDSKVVDTWAPNAPLDQMTPAGPKILYAAPTPINADTNLWFHGGGTPQLRFLVTR